MWCLCTATLGNGADIRSGGIHGQPFYILDHWKNLTTHVRSTKIIQVMRALLYYRCCRYNMIGHCKFCVTLLGGFLLFRDPIILNQFLGILSTVSGITVYIFFKLRDTGSSTTLGKQTQKV